MQLLTPNLSFDIYAAVYWARESLKPLF